MINMYDSANFLSSYCTDIPFFFVAVAAVTAAAATAAAAMEHNVLESTLLGIQWWNWGWRRQGHAYGILTFH